MTRADTGPEPAPHRQRGAAFVIPWVSVGIAGSFAPELVRAGASSGLALTASFYVGLVAGACWQVLNRRDFVDRFLGLALLLATLVLIPAFAGDHRASGADTFGSWAWPGVIVGVVLAEGWMRQKHRP